MAVSLTQISGTVDQVSQLPAIGGLEVMIHSAAETAPGIWQVEAYATQAAIAAVGVVGATVAIVLTEAEVQAELDAGWAGVDAPPVA